MFVCFLFGTVFIRNVKPLISHCVCRIWWPSAPLLVAKMIQEVSTKTCQTSCNKSGHCLPYVHKHLKHLRCFKVFGVSQGLQKSTRTTTKTNICCWARFPMLFTLRKPRNAAFRKTIKNIRCFSFSGLWLLIKVNKISWHSSWAHLGRLGAIFTVRSHLTRN